MQCIISPCSVNVTEAVRVWAPSNLSLSDRQAGDLINQTQNFISRCKRHSEKDARKGIRSASAEKGFFKNKQKNLKRPRVFRISRDALSDQSQPK